MNRAVVRLDSERLSALLQSMLEQWDVSIPVAGNSMYPLWKHGRDSVVLRKCDSYALKKGDIALYRRSTGQVVLHRIIKANEDSYHMCGDAQTIVERYVPKVQVIAAAVAFTRNGREYHCGQLAYRMYAVLWIWLLPVRAVMGKGLRLWRRCMQ